MIEEIRAWARRHTERDRYSPIGVAFHWVMAALILFQLGWGWYTSMLPAGGAKLLGYRLHSAVGVLILVLAGGRLAWRIIVPGPVNDADRLGWQTQAAYATHYVFYICFIGLPLSGWAMWSALGTSAPLSVGGVLPWPLLPFQELSPDWQWRILRWAEDVHYVLILTLVVFVPLHVAAALKHHFWNRHDVLRGMLPEIPDEEKPPAARRHRPRAIGSRPA